MRFLENDTKEILKENGIKVISNRCIYVEYMRRT